MLGYLTRTAVRGNTYKHIASRDFFGGNLYTALQDALRVLSMGLQNISGLYLESLVPKLLLSRSDAAEGDIEELDLEWDGFLWAVPKKRVSHSKKRMRSAHKYLKPKTNFIVCPECKNLKLLHVLCAYCLKEILQKTAKMRRAELETKLQQLARKASDSNS